MNSRLGVAGVKLLVVLLVVIMSFGYIPAHASEGSILVNVTADQPEYQVTYHETGLPIGYSWTVRVITNNSGNTSFSSNSSVLNFNETNGSYRYVVESSTSYVTPESSGFINISGAGEHFQVNFNRIAVSEFYEPFLLINASERSSFNLSPQLGPSAMSFGVMNTTMNIQIMSASGRIYDDNITGEHTNFQASMPTDEYGYLNFNVTGGITITAINIGRSKGYFAFDLWNYYISNYSASLITMPPHYAEYFGTGAVVSDVPTYTVQNNTGVSFTLTAPYYKQDVPLSIWISEGYYNSSGQVWWGQVGFNNWATDMYDVSYAGWGVFSEKAGNPGGTDTNYPLIPNETYNFTMEQVSNGSWGFFVNGLPIVEQGVSAYFKPPVDMVNQAYLGVELLDDQRAGPLNYTSIFNGSIIIPNAESFKIDGKWVKAANVSFVYGGQDWENGNGGPPPGYNLWGVEGNIQNGSIPPGEIILNNGHYFPFDIPSNSGYDVYPISGNFSFPYGNFSSYGSFISVSEESNGTILINPASRNTLVSVMTFKGTSDILQNEYNIIISKPVYVITPSLYSDAAISAVPLNYSTSTPGYSGKFQEIALRDLFNSSSSKFSFSLGNVNTSYSNNIYIPVYFNDKAPLENLRQIYSFDPSLLSFNGVINNLASQYINFSASQPASGIIQLNATGEFNIVSANMSLFYLSFTPLINEQFSTEVLLDSTFINGNSLHGNSSSRIVAASGWQNIGPSDVLSPGASTAASGIVSNIGYAPGNLSVLYAVSGQDYPLSGPIGYPGDTGFGGVFKSTNGGKTWTMEDLGLNTTSVTAILVNPDNNNEIVVETRGLSSIVGGAIYKSINGGMSWQETYGLGGFYLQYVNGTLYATTFHSLLESRNFGTTWTQIASFSDVVTSSLILDNGRVIYLGLYEQDNYSTVDGMPAVNDKVVLSTDWGYNFSVISGFNQSEFDNKIPSISQIVADPSNNSEMWAIVSSPYNGRELGNPSLFRSFDGGYSWEIANTSALGMGYLSEPPIYITYDPSNSSIVYIDSISHIFKSTDGGNYFQNLNTYNMPFSLNALINVDPQNDSILFLCSTQGLYESENQGKSWFPLANISSNLLFDVAVDGSSIFATDEGLSPLYSNDSGHTWTTINKGYVGIVSVDPYNSSVVIMWTETHTTAGGPFFYVSDNGGSSFFLPQINFTKEVNEFVDSIGFSSSHILVPGGSGIFVSSNNGVSWSLLNNSPQDAFTVAVAPSEQNLVYSSNLSGLFESTDYGSKWVKVNGGIFESIAVDPINSSIIAGSSGTSAMISYDGGKDFQYLGIMSNEYGLTSAYIYFYDLSGKPVLVFSTDHGLFVSENMGNSWINSTYNIPSPVISSFFMTPGGASYVSTYGSGIWYDPALLNLTFFMDPPLLTGYIPTGMNLTVNGIKVNTSGYFLVELKQGNNSVWDGKQFYINATDGNIYFLNLESLQIVLSLKQENLPEGTVWAIWSAGKTYNITGTASISLPLGTKSISVFPVRADYSIYYPVRSNITLNSSISSSIVVPFTQVERNSPRNITSILNTNTFWTTQIAYGSGYVLYGGGGDMKLMNISTLSVTDIQEPFPNGQVYTVEPYRDGFLIGGKSSPSEPGLMYYDIRSGSLENLSGDLPSSQLGANPMVSSIFIINGSSFGIIGGAAGETLFGIFDNGTFHSLAQYLPSYFTPQPNTFLSFSGAYMTSEDSVVISSGNYFGVFNLADDTYSDLTEMVSAGTTIGSSYYYSPSTAYIASNGKEAILTGTTSSGGEFVCIYNRSSGLTNISDMFPQSVEFNSVTWSGHDFILSGGSVNGSPPQIYVLNPSSYSLTTIPTSYYGNVRVIDSAILINSTLLFTSFGSRPLGNYSQLFSFYGLDKIAPTGEAIVQTNVPSELIIGKSEYSGQYFPIPEFIGSYSASVESPGYAPYNFTLTVDQFSTNYYNVVLQLLYEINFNETGLPSGTSWSVTFNGTTQSSSTNTIIFTEPNGTYSYTVGIYNGYSASPYSGTVIINGAAQNVAITFTRVTYSVTFTESGLPSGTVWYINISNGQSYKSTGTEISLNEPNGTYSYVVSSSNNNYSPNPSSGSFTVNGSSVSQSISFSEVTYSVTFTESGLLSGTSWSVTLNNVTETSTNSTITFHEPYGTYSYSIGSVSGYTASPSSGSITVNGANVNQAVMFTATTTTSSFNYLIYVIIAVVVIAAVVGVALAIGRRKNKPSKQ